MAPSAEIHTLLKVVVEPTQRHRQPLRISATPPQHTLCGRACLRRRWRWWLLSWWPRSEAAVGCWAHDVGAPRSLVHRVSHQARGRSCAAERELDARAEPELERPARGPRLPGGGAARGGGAHAAHGPRIGVAVGEQQRLPRGGPLQQRGRRPQTEELF